VDALSALLFPALLVAAFYFLIIRPARVRQKEALRLQDELAPGQQVMTTSGIFGRVSAVEDDAVALEVSPGVTLRVAKPAIGRIIPADVAGSDGGPARRTDDEPTEGERPV
jgi:preprotein translocase subunit YajC